MYFEQRLADLSSVRLYSHVAKRSGSDTDLVSQTLSPQFFLDSFSTFMLNFNHFNVSKTWKESQCWPFSWCLGQIYLPHRLSNCLLSSSLVSQGIITACHRLRTPRGLRVSGYLHLERCRLSSSTRASRSRCCCWCATLQVQDSRLFGTFSPLTLTVTLQLVEFGFLHMLKQRGLKRSQLQQRRIHVFTVDFELLPKYDLMWSDFCDTVTISQMGGGFLLKFSS